MPKKSPGMLGSKLAFPEIVKTTSKNQLSPELYPYNTPKVTNNKRLTFKGITGNNKSRQSIKLQDIKSPKQN